MLNALSQQWHRCLNASSLPLSLISVIVVMLFHFLISLVRQSPSFFLAKRSSASCHGDWIVREEKSSVVYHCSVVF